MDRSLYLPPAGWVREPVVIPHTPYRRTKLREEIAAGRFPAPKKFSERVVAFDAAQVHAWIKDPDAWIAKHAPSAKAQPDDVRQMPAAGPGA